MSHAHCTRNRNRSEWRNDFDPASSQVSSVAPHLIIKVMPTSNIRLKNLKLAISRRISQLGYADKLKVTVGSRKVIIIRI